MPKRCVVERFLDRNNIVLPDAERIIIVAGDVGLGSKHVSRVKLKTVMRCDWWGEIRWVPCIQGK